MHNKQKIRALEYLSESGEVTATQLSDAMGFASRSHAPMVLKSFWIIGLVSRRKLSPQGGRPAYAYTITEKGLQRLEWLKAKEVVEEVEIFISGDDNDDD